MPDQPPRLNIGVGTRIGSHLSGKIGLIEERLLAGHDCKSKLSARLSQSQHHGSICRAVDPGTGPGDDVVGVSGDIKNPSPRPCAGVHVATPRRRQRLQPQPLRKIVPRRIVALDQVAFPLPAIAFDMLLARDRRFHRGGNFEPDQPMDGVAFRKAAVVSVAMLDYARDQVRCYADIERAVEAAGEHVDAGDAFSHRRLVCRAVDPGTRPG